MCVCNDLIKSCLKKDICVSGESVVCVCVQKGIMRVCVCQLAVTGI